MISRSTSYINKHVVIKFHLKVLIKQHEWEMSWATVHVPFAENSHLLPDTWILKQFISTMANESLWKIRDVACESSYRSTSCRPTSLVRAIQEGPITPYVFTVNGTKL